MDRQPPPARTATDPQQRARSMQRVTLTAIVTNALLALGQLIIGLAANAFSLVADSVHTLSDLFTDMLVLLAGRHGAHPADRDHPYGHGRIETATTLILGSILTMVGLGFLWSSGVRLQNMASAPQLHTIALYMALATLAAKEGLFRYTLAASKRLKAPVLEANAWHARSDAASSLVVAAGIGGSLAGYPFLEPLAAAVVGFLVLHMGVRLAWKAMRELIDTGLSEHEIARLHATVRGTPGVIDLHDLRTRRMADRVLCDTHVQVDPHITVSEGHRISDAVYLRIRAAHPEVRDVLVHIDAEDDADLRHAPPGPLPERTEVRKTMLALLGDDATEVERIQIHYLGQRIEVEIIVSKALSSRMAVDALNQRISALLSAQPAYRSISVFARIAP
jgi:cation diffusion facilitator family transporter